MPPAEVAGMAALAIVVVREAFSLLRWTHARRNGTGTDQVMRTVQDEISRLRDQMLIVSTAVATLQGEMIRRERP